MHEREQPRRNEEKIDIQIWSNDGDKACYHCQKHVPLHKIIAAWFNKPDHQHLDARHYRIDKMGVVLGTASDFLERANDEETLERLGIEHGHVLGVDNMLMEADLARWDAEQRQKSLAGAVADAVAAASTAVELTMAALGNPSRPEPMATPPDAQPVAAAAENAGDGARVSRAGRTERPHRDERTEGPSTEVADGTMQSTVIGELEGSAPEVAQGKLLVGQAADVAADAAVELSHTPMSQVVKLDPEAAPLNQVRAGVSLPPREVVNPVIVAHGSLQVPRRRARTEIGTNDAAFQSPQHAARRSRRDRPTTHVSAGNRVSCVFEHYGQQMAFEGTVKEVLSEFRSCNVDFDDGTSHRISMSRLTLLVR